MVRLQNIGMRYGPGEEILSDVSFELAAGSFHFLTGPSGAGKSTLLKLMHLAERPTRGWIRIFGKDVTTLPRSALPALRRRIGIVFQDFRLLNHLSTLENVALPLRLAGAKKKEIIEHVTELLKWVGLADQINARPPTLSGGQKQRVAIARAVISRPSLLLADEPTGNVDEQSAMRILRLFEELNKIGTTVVIATHNESLVGQFSYPALRLTDGKLVSCPQDAAPPERDAAREIA